MGRRKVGSGEESPFELNSVAGMAAYGRALKMQEQPFRMPALEDLAPWKGRRAMVFAPHQDDDVLGCGGTIKRLLDIGAEVRVVYVTDGRRGSVSAREGLAAVRRREAIEALRVLGCQDHSFLGFEDGRLEVSEEAVAGAREEISAFGPHAVFVPSPLDGPRDHIISSAIVSEALRRHRARVECFNYEIWNPILPNCLVDISEVVGTKEQAIRRHHSQMEIVDYVHHFRGLNAYRAIYTTTCTYCEAFLRMGGEEQVRLCNEVLRWLGVRVGGA